MGTTCIPLLCSAFPRVGEDADVVSGDQTRKQAPRMLAIPAPKKQLSLRASEECPKIPAAVAPNGGRGSAAEEGMHGCACASRLAQVLPVSTTLHPRFGQGGAQSPDERFAGCRIPRISYPRHLKIGISQSRSERLLPQKFATNLGEGAVLPGDQCTGFARAIKKKKRMVSIS